jgi:hypothetical protein
MEGCFKRGYDGCRQMEERSSGVRAACRQWTGAESGSLWLTGSGRRPQMLLDIVAAITLFGAHLIAAITRARGLKREQGSPEGHPICSDGRMTSMPSTNSPLRWVPAFIMMALIFMLSSLPANRLPYFGAVDFLVKKGSHATGYALLGLAYFYALPPRLSAGYRAVVALVMALLFALSDEYHQSFVEGRTSSLRDVFIDGGGATIALVIASFYSSNSRSRSASS